MTLGPTIGVLSTSFGGAYFGGVLGGIARATATVGGRLMAVQTLDAGTVDVDLSEPPPFAHPVGWDHVAGFVVILNAANAAYLDAARAAGKPVVIISEVVDGFACPAVLPDNGIGVREAVAHLVGHGHRDIAFAGYPVQRDFRERHEAYREALLEHGIEPRADLFFNTGNNQESGGEHAARTMIGAGMRSTAVITGNDLNAIGLVRMLSQAGYELPRDQAIVGFDDLDGVVYLTPSLSTVRQRFDRVGAVAVELLLAQLNGREVRHGPHYVPTHFVARESCGCPDPLALHGGTGTATGPAAAPITSPEHLAARLAGVGAAGAPAGAPALAGTPTPAVDRAADRAVHRAVSVITGVLHAAERDVVGPGWFAVREALTDLHRLNPDPEALTGTIRSVRRFGRHLSAVATDPAAADRIADHTDELVVALAQTQARAQFRDGAYFQHLLKTQYAVSINLLRGHEEDPRALAWLRVTRARAGCIGLWPISSAEHAPAGPRPAGPMPAAPVPELDVHTVFDRDAPRAAAPSLRSSMHAFPPAEIVSRADLVADEMVFVAPMKVGPTDWGMLAVVGPIEANVSTGREMMNQWAALLTIALDHEEVLKSLREQEERLRQAALYDPLTGLANRTLFLERLTHAIQRTRRRADLAYAVLLLDLDGFKVVNDSLGHVAGDQLLVMVAERIRGSARESDTAARFGGDEFAILLDDITDLDSPVTIAERVHAVLDEPFRLGDEEVVVSFSIGISSSATGYDHAEDVIRDADTAMYTAKCRGKGSHAIFNPAMHTRAVSRLRTEAELRRALDMGELEVHYQPVVRLATGAIAGFEALVRWRHPTRGTVLPADFLSVAEESGLMLPVGRWVLGESCHQLRRWQQEDGGPGIAPERADIRVSVNVSNREFWHGRLIADVREFLGESGLHPRALILEITEGVVMHDVKQARRMLEELREMGVDVHIDDFGTGYSSLEVLHQLSVDALKIDRSFVSALGTDPRSAELLRTIILMGANLNMEIVAEGIETVEQRDALRRLGATYGQGYLFSKPVPPDRAERFLRGPVPAGR